MNLERVIRWEVNGKDLDEAKKAIEQLPEGVLSTQEIILEKSNREEKTFLLRTTGSLFSLRLPEGLSNIHIYRTNDEAYKKDNGRVSFDYKEFHYIIPSLED